MPPSDTFVPPVLVSLAGPAPARLWPRALALLLDTLLAGVAAGIIVTGLVLPQQYPGYKKIVHDQLHAIRVEFRQAMDTGQVSVVDPSDEFTEIAVTTGLTVFMVLVAYFAVSEMVSGGETLGKRVFRLRVVRWGTTDPPLLIESLSRSIFKAASLIALWPLLLLANALPMICRPARRTGHDYLARTSVTGEPPPVPAPGRRARDEED